MVATVIVTGIPKDKIKLILHVFRNLIYDYELAQPRSISFSAVSDERHDFFFLSII